MKVVGESVCSAENWIPLNEGLLEYRGLLHAMPQLLNTNVSVMNRLDGLRKAQISQKVGLKCKKNWENVFLKKYRQARHWLRETLTSQKNFEEAWYPKISVLRLFYPCFSVLIHILHKNAAFRSRLSSWRRRNGERRRSVIRWKRRFSISTTRERATWANFWQIFSNFKSPPIKRHLRR